ncbi:hypothetical protein DdX_03762 [Ditylenchus destructor]|uniref:Glycine zipper 2TM domain-containing protein n=1 Tax=Ditylenchus destructor TaxID=166010 RepID=A0AAD4NFV3_9BILA|nr:hypothetical protein DdX_03762 [Ditylenchus destructor]
MFNLSSIHLFFLVQVICAVLFTFTGAQHNEGSLSTLHGRNSRFESLGQGSHEVTGRRRIFSKRGVLKGAAIGALAGGAIGGITKKGK